MSAVPPESWPEAVWVVLSATEKSGTAAACLECLGIPKAGFVAAMLAGAAEGTRWDPLLSGRAAAIGDRYGPMAWPAAWPDTWVLVRVVLDKTRKAGTAAAALARLGVTRAAFTAAMLGGAGSGTHWDPVASCRASAIAGKLPPA